MLRWVLRWQVRTAPQPQRHLVVMQGISTADLWVLWPVQKNRGSAGLAVSNLPEYSAPCKDQSLPYSSLHIVFRCSRTPLDPTEFGAPAAGKQGSEQRYLGPREPSTSAAAALTARCRQGALRPHVWRRRAVPLLGREDLAWAAQGTEHRRRRLGGSHGPGWGCGDAHSEGSACAPWGKDLIPTVLRLPPSPPPPLPLCCLGIGCSRFPPPPHSPFASAFLVSVLSRGVGCEGVVNTS